MQCNRKVRYATREAAQQTAAALYRLQAARLSIYGCGDYWHIGDNRRPHHGRR